MKEYFQYKSAGEEGGGAQPEWYPAGISPTEYAERAVCFGVDAMDNEEVCEMEWMDEHSVSTKDVHKAAALMR